MTGTVNCISFGSELRARIRRDLHPVGPLRSARHARYGMVYCSECGSQVHNRNDSDLTSSYLPKSTHHDLSGSITVFTFSRTSTACKEKRKYRDHEKPMLSFQPKIDFKYSCLFSLSISKTEDCVHICRNPVLFARIDAGNVIVHVTTVHVRCYNSFRVNF